MSIVNKKKLRCSDKLQDLLILLTSTFINDVDLNKILEDNMRILEDNRAVRVLEERGSKKREIAIVINMLQGGEDYAKISKFTGLDLERIEELDNERKATSEAATG